DSGNRSSKASLKSCSPSPSFCSSRAKRALHIRNNSDAPTDSMLPGEADRFWTRIFPVQASPSAHPGTSIHASCVPTAATGPRRSFQSQEAAFLVLQHIRRAALEAAARRVRQETRLYLGVCSRALWLPKAHGRVVAGSGRSTRSCYRSLKDRLTRARYSQGIQGCEDYHPILPWLLVIQFPLRSASVRADRSQFPWG